MIHNGQNSLNNLVQQTTQQLAVVVEGDQNLGLLSSSQPILMGNDQMIIQEQNGAYKAQNNNYQPVAYYDGIQQSNHQIQDSVDDQIKDQEQQQFVQVQQEELEPHQLDANVFQMAIINKILPKGYKFEQLDAVQRMVEANKKRKPSQTNVNLKKPEIQNEKKQQRIMQKYQQKKYKEQLKLEKQSTVAHKDKNGLIKHDKHSSQKNDSKSKLQMSSNDDYQGSSQQQQSKKASKSRKKHNDDGPNESRMRDDLHDDDDDSEDSSNSDSIDSNNYQPKFKSIAQQSKKVDSNHINNSLPKINRVIQQVPQLNLVPLPAQPIAPPSSQIQQLNAQAQQQQIVEQGIQQQTVVSNKKEVSMEGNAQIAQVMPMADYQSKVFNDVDMSKFKLYDKYRMLLDSLINHSDLTQYIQLHKIQPMFLRIPETYFVHYEQIKKENEGEGFLNFQMIQHRMRNKKYGPGKNIINEELIQLNIRNVFTICEKYFSQDEPSITLSRVLQMHFENELAVSPSFQGQMTMHQSKQQVPNSKFTKVNHHQQNDQQKQSQLENGHFQMEDVNSDSTQNKNDKKDKKKEKKDKNKKNKEKGYKEVLPQNGVHPEKQTDEDEEQVEAKQQLFEVITTHLTMEQKKGIIPIVFQQETQDKKKKYEFDLFSLEPHVFKRLQDYVYGCAAQKNQGSKSKQALAKVTQSEKTKGGNKNEPSVDVQNQIDQKLRENKMSLDTEIVDRNKKPIQNGQASKQKALDCQNNQRDGRLYNLSDLNQKYNEDRFLLIEKINKLTNKQLKGIVPIVKDQSGKNAVPDSQPQNSQKLEFDLYELSDQKCKELHNYIENCLIINEQAIKADKSKGGVQEIQTNNRVTIQKHDKPISNIQNKPNHQDAPQNHTSGSQQEQPQDSIAPPCLPNQQPDQQKIGMIEQLEHIQSMDGNGLVLINYLSKLDEFNKLQPLSEDQQKELYDAETGSLNVKLITSDQMVFLLSVFQSSDLKQKYIQLMNQQNVAPNQVQNDQDQDHVQQNAIQPVNNIYSQEDQMFAQYSPDYFTQYEQQARENIDVMEKNHLYEKEMIMGQLQDQNAQLQQNTQLSSQIRSSLQDGAQQQFQSVSVIELQSTLEKTTQNEEILKQNIASINNYMDQRQEEHNQKMRETQEELDKQLDLKKRFEDWQQRQSMNNQMIVPNPLNNLSQQQPDLQVQIGNNNQIQMQSSFQLDQQQIGQQANNIIQDQMQQNDQIAMSNNDPFDQQNIVAVNQNIINNNDVNNLLFKQEQFDQQQQDQPICQTNVMGLTQQIDQNNKNIYQQSNDLQLLQIQIQDGQIGQQVLEQQIQEQQEQPPDEYKHQLACALFGKQPIREGNVNQNQQEIGNNQIDNFALQVDGQLVDQHNYQQQDEPFDQQLQWQVQMMRSQMMKEQMIVGTDHSPAPLQNMDQQQQLINLDQQQVQMNVEQLQVAENNNNELEQQGVDQAAIVDQQQQNIANQQQASLEAQNNLVDQLNQAITQHNQYEQDLQQRYAVLNNLLQMQSFAQNNLNNLNMQAQNGQEVNGQTQQLEEIKLVGVSGEQIVEQQQQIQLNQQAQSQLQWQMQSIQQIQSQMQIASQTSNSIGGQLIRYHQEAPNDGQLMQPLSHNDAGQLQPISNIEVTQSLQQQQWPQQFEQ